MPYEGPNTNRRVFISTTGWRDIKDEDKKRVAAAVMKGLGLWNFVQFEGLWFYLWLVQRARKNLTPERRQELLDEANEAERNEEVEFKV